MAAFGFAPATEEERFSLKTLQRSADLTRSALSGQEARSFYETLTRDDRPGGSNSRRGDRRPGSRKQRRVGVRGHQEAPAGVREAAHSERTKELMGLQFLRCAHEGNVPGLEELLSKGVDINFQDAFFWTALMCASWSGRAGAVGLLLRRGAAWVGVVDTQGRDARRLAEQAGQRAVLEVLDNYGIKREKETPSDSSAPRPHWCDVCESEYSSSPSAHLSTTLHQFSLRRPPPAPHYCLPPSSNGYKMMVRSGWTPGRGLGPEGDGRHQPVPTVLKRDQRGLGFGKGRKAKVTHFGARDGDAVKPASREKEERGGKAQRAEERRKEQRDKNWERDFRCSFYL